MRDFWITLKVYAKKAWRIRSKVTSADREFDLANRLVDELKRTWRGGCACGRPNCYVYGTIPATPGCEPHGTGNQSRAHMDTAPDFSGENVSRR